MKSVTQQPLVADHATVPHMEAISIPFHMRYGSLICSKRLQSDRPKCWSMLVEAGEPRKHAEIGFLVLGLIPNYLVEKFNFFYPDIAQVLLFQMRYGSLMCSKKWLSDRPKCWGMLFEAEGNNSTGVMWKQGLPQPFCLSPGCFSELGKLSYLIWKRGFRAICWYIFLIFFQANRYYLSMFLSCSRVCHMSSTISYVTL